MAAQLMATNGPWPRFAGAALAVHEDRGAAGGGQLDPPIRLLHALRLAGELSEGALLLELVPEEAELAGE